MRREMEQIDLRQAFAPEPEACHKALMQAACSVKEDEPVKKYTMRTMLIAALIIVAMMAVAIAATQGGLTGWFQKHYRADVPQTAQTILSTTEKSTLEAGPVVFTISELLCDGKIAYLTAEAHLKESDSAILYPSSGDPYDRIGDVMAAKLNHPSISETSTYLEAAQITGLPLYCVNAWLEVENANLIETEMMDGNALEDGGQLLVDMLYFNEVYAGEALPVQVHVAVNEVDLNTIEFKTDSGWRALEERVMPIHGVMAEKQYVPVEEGMLSGCLHLTGVTAKQTCAGVYVYIQMESPTPITLEEVFSMNDEYHVLDDSGTLYPVGLSLTAEYLDSEGYPFPYDVPMEEIEFTTMQYMVMISVNELPEAFTVTDGTVKIRVE